MQNLIGSLKFPLNIAARSSNITTVPSIPLIDIEWSKSLTSKQLLLDNPTGVYTTMRTIGAKIMDLSMHMDRISAGLELKSKIAHSDSLVIKSNIRKLLAASITEFRKNYPSDEPTCKDAELKITLLACRAPENGDTPVVDMKAHVNLLDTVTPLFDSVSHRKFVDVELSSLANVARHDPGVKDTQWVRDRQRLLDGMKSPQTSNEVILQDIESGRLFEGLSSNLVVIKLETDGKYVLETAPLDSVLPGTIQKLVLEYCSKQAFPVSFRHPSRQDLVEGKWKAAFLTSTSRILLNIGRVYVPEVGGNDSMRTDGTWIGLLQTDPSQALVTQIREGVWQLMQEKAETISA